MTENGNAIAAVADYSLSERRLFIWDLSKALKSARTKMVDRSEKQFESLWLALGEKEPTKAYSAYCGLFATPTSTCKFLKSRMKAVEPRGQAAVKAWLADLDSEKFAIRARAEDLIETLDIDALPILVNELNLPTTSLEKRRRLERIVERLKVGSIPPGLQRALWGIELLEQINSARSRELLSEIAHGDSTAWLTIEANVSLGRLSLRSR